MNRLVSLPTRLLEGVHGAGGSSLDNSLLQQEQPSEMLIYWRAVMARKWLILGLAIALAVATYFYVGRLPSIYRSTAVLLIESSRAKVTSIEEVYSNVSANREYFQTQAEVLRSREVAQQAIRRLDLINNPEFDPRRQPPPFWLEVLSEYLPRIAAWFASNAPPPDEATVEASVLRSFTDQLSIDPVRLSQLVKISFESRDPKLAAKAANEVVNSYIQLDMTTRIKITQNAGDLISQHLGDLKAKLDASEKALQAYRDREGILDSKSSNLSGTSRQFEEMTQRLIEARVRRTEIEEAYNQAATANGHLDSVPAVVRSVSVQRAKEKESEAYRRLTELSQRYGPDHPRLAAATSDLTAAKDATKRETDAVINSITREYNAARATEKAMEQALAQAKGAIQSMNRKEIQLTALERDVDSNRQLYQTFLSRFKETTVTTDGQQASARVIDLAVPVLVPVRPAKTRLIAISFIAGILLGIAITLFLNTLDNTLRSSEEVESKTQQPLLAALPSLPRSKLARAGSFSTDSPDEVYSEGIRTALTGILLSTLDERSKILAITSSIPDEGKSTFSTNLALWSARTKRTLLIDCDMRRPSVASSLNLPPNRAGLAEFISGTLPLKDCVTPFEESPVHIMVAGRGALSPLDVLLSDRFKESLQALRAHYDMVIIDTPPINLVSDALVLGTYCTGIIYVVKAGKTPVQLVRKCLNRFVNANIRIIGIVLNSHDFKKAERYYGEYSATGKYGYTKSA